MLNTLTANLSNTTLTILHDAKSAYNPHKAEAANRTLQVYSISRSHEAHKLGTGFDQLASDLVSGVAAAFACTPPLDQNCTLGLLGVVRCIDRFAKERLSQTHLRRLWRHRSDQLKVAEYGEVLRQHLAVLELQLDLSIEDNVARIRTAQGENSSKTVFSSREQTAERDADKSIDGHGPAMMVSNGLLASKGGDPTVPPPTLKSLSNPSGSRLQNAYVEPHTCRSCVMAQRKIPTHPLSCQNGSETDHTISPEPYPQIHAQNTESLPPPRHVHQQPETASSGAAAPPLPDLSSLPQTSNSPMLGSSVTVFFIEQLTTNITSHTANRHSGNTTMTTVVDSANDSSRWSSQNFPTLL